MPKKASHITVGIVLEPKGWRADIIDSRLADYVVVTRAFYSSWQLARAAIEEAALARGWLIEWHSSVLGEIHAEKKKTRS
jgi:hypothetical protein